MGWYSAQDLPWPINLVGLDQGTTGDLITQEGEIIGTWTLDAEGHPGFIPNGETEIVVWHPFIPMFCDEVAGWLAERDARNVNESDLAPANPANLSTRRT